VSGGHFREAHRFCGQNGKNLGQKKGTERFYTMYTIRSEEIENFSHLIRTHLTPHAEPTRQVS
jgi:hypothetical protein